MRKPQFILSIFLLLFSSVIYATAEKSSIELLDLPAYPSKIANKSIVMSLEQSNDGVLVVGERGHILLWQSDDNWQQQAVPVSVAITSVKVLADGSKIAVGHDSVILKSEKDSDQWAKVFTGWELTSLKIALMQSQQKALQTVIDKTKDEDELDELSYQLDDIIFGIEDAELEKTAGPNQPLLGVTQAKNGALFSVGAYGLFLTSVDNGNTWKLISNRLENPDKFHLNSIIRTASNQLFIVGENGMAFKSVDNGMTWATLTMPYSGSLFGIISNPKAANELVAFGLQGNLMVSTNNGKSWNDTKLPTSTSLLGGTFLSSGQAILVGHGGITATLNVDNLATLKIKQHPSGAAFSSVLEQDEQLILGGQYGVEFWQLKNDATSNTTKKNTDK